MSGWLQLCISALCLTIAAFLFYLMYKEKSLITKNNNIHVGEGGVVDKSKYTLNQALILILIVMLIILLTLTVVSNASTININNASTASIVFNDGQNVEPKININTATVAELVYLKGIGEAKAQQIIEYRTEHPFKNTTELLNIIGEQTYNNIKNVVTTEN